MSEPPQPVAGNAPPSAEAAEPTAGVVRPQKTSGRRGALWHFVSITTGVIAGGSMLLLAHKYFAAKVFPSPQVVINYQVFSTPNPKLVPDLLLPIINGARSEIIVVANDISSRMMLEALCKKRAEGIDVVILLSADGGMSRSAQWIRSNKAGRLFVDSTTSTDQFLVVDGRNVILTSLPFNSTAPSEIASVGLAVEDSTLATEMRRLFYKRIASLSPAS